MSTPMIDLTDRAAVNEAVHASMPFRNHVWCTHCGIVGSSSVTPEACLYCGQRIRTVPDYLGDDPRLNDEMEKALRERCDSVNVDWSRKAAPAEAWRVACWLTDNLHMSGAWETGATKAEALVRALAAAGVVTLPEEDSR